MTFYISLKKYLSDNPLKLILVGRTLYDSNKRSVGTYVFTGPTGLVYSMLGTTHIQNDVYFCFDITKEYEIEALTKWAKTNGYKLNIEII